MANFIEVAKRLIRPYYYYIIATLVLIIFVYAGNYAYNQFYAKKVANKYANVSNANRRNKEVDIIFFHVDWCPHCKKALPEWNTFKQQYDGKETNGYVVKCIDMDCTTESSDIARAINTYKIDSYPTIKMLKDQQTIEFDSKITVNSLEQFVNTMLNN
jgi:thiol-disulfide isomerase/thioredoxin